MSVMTPREIVHSLDQHIIGQTEAKRAVAIALRNRWRRQQLDAELRAEITPKNILMIGPTGVGKTEIARRLAKLANARQEQNKVEQYQASFKQRKGGKVQEDKALSELADLELEMSVEGWEFNSQNAIAEEYVESYTDVVSTL